MPDFNTKIGNFKMGGEKGIRKRSQIDFLIILQYITGMAGRGGSEHLSELAQMAMEVGGDMKGTLEKLTAYGDAANSLQAVIPEITETISNPTEGLKVLTILNNLVAGFLQKSLEPPKKR